MEAGLSQAALAEKIGTSHAAISRLETVNCDQHSLALLNRVARGPNRKSATEFTSQEPEEEKS